MRPNWKSVFTVIGFAGSLATLLDLAAKLATLVLLVLAIVYFMRHPMAEPTIPVEKDQQCIGASGK